MTERVRYRVQAAEMGFLQKFRGLSLPDKVKSTDICQSFNIESLLLRIEKLLLRWYIRMIRMSQERIAKLLIDALPSRKVLEGDSELAGEILLKT